MVAPTYVIVLILSTLFAVLSNWHSAARHNPTTIVDYVHSATDRPPPNTKYIVDVLVLLPILVMLLGYRQTIEIHVAIVMYVVIMILKSILTCATILPNLHGHTEIKPWYSVTGNTSDYLPYSGHTVLVCVMVFMLISLGAISRTVGLFYVAVTLYFIVYVRNHYSIDVINGFIVTSLVYALYLSHRSMTQTYIADLVGWRA